MAKKLKTANFSNCISVADQFSVTEIDALTEAAKVYAGDAEPETKHYIRAVKDILTTLTQRKDAITRELVSVAKTRTEAEKPVAEVVPVENLSYDKFMALGVKARVAEYAKIDGRFPELTDEDRALAGALAREMADKNNTGYLTEYTAAVERAEQTRVEKLREEFAGAADEERVSGSEEDRLLFDLIDKVNEAKDKTLYENLLTNLMEYVFSTDANDRRALKSLGNKSRAQIAEEALAEQGRSQQVLNALVRFLDLQVADDPEYKIPTANKKGEWTPLFKTILEANLFHTASKKYGLQNLPQDFDMTQIPKLVSSAYKSMVPTVRSRGRFSIADYDSTDGLVDANNKPIKAPLVIGRIRIAVNRFVAGLINRPTVHIYKNQADLKARNPELYARAVAARPEGDFDTVSAVGYSFGRVGTVRPEVDETRRRIIKGAAGAIAMPGNLLKLFAGQKAVPTYDEFLTLFSSVNDAVEQAIRPYEISASMTNEVKTGYLIEDAFYNTAYEVNYSYGDLLWGLESGAYEGELGDSAFKNFYDQNKDNVVNILERASTAQIKAVAQVVEKILETATKPKSLKKGTAKKESAQRSAEVVPEDDSAVVIIFSDRVMTEDQLKFVLAHETLGHFGFRAIVPEGKLNAVLNDIYNSHDNIKAAVDADIAANGKSKSEAIEEYLADMAGSLDTSIIAKFWNAVKNFFNKLGVKFADDAARYFINQSRRYVRNGAVSNAFSNSAIARNIHAIESMDDPSGSGRFSEDRTSYARANWMFGTRGQAANYDPYESLDYVRRMQVSGANFMDSVERIISDLKLTNYAARENFGMERVYTILDDMTTQARKLVNTYNENMPNALHRAVKIGDYEFFGSTEEEIKAGGLIFVDNSLAKFDLYEGNSAKSLPSLIDFSGGTAKVNTKNFNALKKLGRFTLEEVQQGVTYKVKVPTEMTPEDKARLTAERDTKVAAAKNQAEAARITKMYDADIEKGVVYRTEERRTQARPNVTEKSKEWIIYNEMFDQMAQAHLDKLISQYAKIEGQFEQVFSRITSIIGRELTEGDKLLVRKLRDKYLEIRNKGASRRANGALDPTEANANEAFAFMATVNAAIVGRDTDRIDTQGVPYAGEPRPPVIDYFPEDERAAIRRAMIDFRANNRVRNLSEEDQERYRIQHEILNLADMELVKEAEEINAKRLIATGYVTLARRGKWQVRVQAVDENGTIYKVDPEFQKFFDYEQTQGRGDAQLIADFYNETFAGDKFRIRVLDDGKYVFKTVSLRATYETAQQTRADPGNMNVNEFMRLITQYGVPLRPEKREQLQKALTSQNDRARKRFKRENQPGYDMDVLRSVSEFLEAAASIVARNTHVHKLDAVFDTSLESSMKLWRGDEGQYNALKDAWEQAQKNPNMSESERMRIKREFNDYHFRFVTHDSQKLGASYMDRARRLVAFVNSQRDIALSEFATGETSSKIRNMTVMAQLGFSIANGLLNLISVGTNVFPYLATYNDKTAFGGGFGFGKAAIALSQAASAVGGPSKNTAAYYQGLLDDSALLSKSGISQYEAEFMRDYILSGRGDASATNSLMATTRGRAKSGTFQRFSELFMAPFSITEQMSRRTSGLAAFRLYFDRAQAEAQIAGRVFDPKQAAKDAAKFAFHTTDNTLGQYANFGMPALFRGGWQQFLFMYKVFPVTTGLLLSNLDRTGKLVLIGTLVMFAGMRGIPYAEDLLDIIDTIAQRLLGITAGSAEAFVYREADKIIPGLGGILARGMDQFLPVTLSSKMQAGNIIPGTSILLPGVDTGREIKEVIGPVTSVVEQSIATAGNIAKYGLETIGLRPDTTTLAQIVRENPVAFFRAIGDAASYASNGAILNANGYVVSDDVSMAVILGRIASFYPSSATRENDVVRLSTRIRNYQRDVSVEFRNKWIRAKTEGDTQRMREIEQAVQVWNESARYYKTGTEINNFVANANRAYRTSQLSGSARGLKALPRATRPVGEELVDILSLEE